MSKLRVNCYSISFDGYSAGPDQTLENPLGVNALQVFNWQFATRAQHQMHGGADDLGGETGMDNDLVLRGFENVGAWILGRNMFGPVRGPWPDDSWKGWWGDNPPYHVPVFVLTHHAREPLAMEGGTTFHFVTDGIHSALQQAVDSRQRKRCSPRRRRLHHPAISSRRPRRRDASRLLPSPHRPRRKHLSRPRSPRPRLPAHPPHSLPQRHPHVPSEEKIAALDPRARLDSISVADEVALHSRQQARLSRQWGSEIEPALRLQKLNSECQNARKNCNKWDNSYHESDGTCLSKERSVDVAQKRHKRC